MKFSTAQMALATMGGLFPQSSIAGLTSRARRSSVSMRSGSYSLSSISFVRSFTTNSTNIGTLRGVYLSPDGLRMYLIGRSPARYIAQYSLSTAFDISTATYINRTTGDAGSTGPTDLWLSADGTKLYESGSGYDGVYERTFGTAWNITTLSAPGSGNYIAYSNLAGLAFNGTGTYLMGVQGGTSRGYSLSAAYNITSPTLLGSLSENFSGVSLSYDGNKMIGAEGISVFEYNLASTGSPVGKTLVNSVNLQTLSGDAALANLTGVHVSILATGSNQNKHLYVVDATSQKVWQFSLA